MGSQINRALSRTDRRRRLTQQQQKQAKKYVKIFNCSMIAILIFGNAFMTSHSSEAHQSYWEYIAISFLSSIFMNFTNPQAVLLCGWLMVMIQALFLNQKITLLFNTGTFLTLYAIFTNFYNYFGFVHPSHPFLKNLVPSALIIIGGLVYELGHCSSHLAKQMRQKERNIEIIQQHGLGLRVIFSILGVMIIILSTIGHMYMKNRRFIPLGLNQQLAYIKSIGIVPMVQIALFVFGLRCLMLNSQQYKQCVSGMSIIVYIVLSFAFVAMFSQTIYKYLTQTNQPRESNKIPNLTTLSLILLYTTSQLLHLPFYLTHPLSLFLTIMIITHTTNLIQNQLRTNYAIAFIIAILCQTNKLENSHNKTDENRFTNIIAYFFCFVLAIGLPYVCDFVKSKFVTKQAISHHNPEHSQLISNHM